MPWFSAGKNTGGFLPPWLVHGTMSHRDSADLGTSWNPPWKNCMGWGNGTGVPPEMSNAMVHLFQDAIHSTHPARLCTKQSEWQSQTTGNNKNVWLITCWNIQRLMRSSNYAYNYSELKWLQPKAPRRNSKPKRKSWSNRQPFNSLRIRLSKWPFSPRTHSHKQNHSHDSPTANYQQPTAPIPPMPAAARHQIRPNTQSTTQTEGQDRDGNPTIRTCRDRDHQEEHSGAHHLTDATAVACSATGFEMAETTALDWKCTGIQLKILCSSTTSWLKCYWSATIKNRWCNGNWVQKC